MKNISINATDNLLTPLKGTIPIHRGLKHARSTYKISKSDCHYCYKK